jgi:thiol-disulfide isomerase/thioredoxin
MEFRMNTRFCSLITGLAAIALFITAVPAYAQPSMEWEENPQIGIEVNGKIDLTAQVFQPISYRPFMLLVSKALKAPVFIDLTQRQVSSLKANDVTINQSFATTAGIPSGKSAGSYTMKGQSSVFKVEGKTVALTVRQTLVGEVTPGTILSYNPEYRLRKDRYKPRQSAIRALKAYTKPTEVVVMFATWCSSCKETLPKALRIFQDAANPRFTVRYIGIAMGGSEPRDAIARYGHDYPAVIFIQNGKEIQRVIGDPPGAMEDLFVKILK